MNTSPQNIAEMPDYLKARKLHLNGIITLMGDMKSSTQEQIKTQKSRC